MENRELDNIIKSKLGGLKVPLPASDWARMEKKLDEAEGAEQAPAEPDALDAIVYQKLRGYETSYAPQNWRMMARLLEREFARPRTILRYKLVEISAVLFMLLLWMQFGPQMPADPSPEVSLPTPGQMLGRGENPSQRPSMPAPEASSLTARLLEFDELPAKAISKVTPIRQKAAIPAGLTGTASEDLVLAPLPAKKITAIHALPDDQKKIPADHSDYSSFESIAELPPAQATLGLAVASLPNVVFAGPKSSYWNIGMFGGVDFNQVMVPGQSTLAFNGLEAFTMGYSGGISIGLETGRWEFGSGFIYTAKQYNPEIYHIEGDFISGYSTNKLRGVELNIINLPINVRYNLVQNKHWRFYAVAGMSLQVAFEANYYISGQDPVLGAAAGSSNVGFSKSSLLNDFRGGWFEDGSFRENAFITANAGIGLEYLIHGQWSVFTQSTYQHSLGYFADGFGPYRDRLNTVSLHTGIRVRLKR